MSNSHLTHALIHEWPEVRGLQVVILETAAYPRSISVNVVGGPDGIREAAQIDSIEPGARAKAISLGELIHDTIEAADFAWAADGEAGDPTT